MVERLQKSLQNNATCLACLLFRLSYAPIMTDEIADIVEFPTDR